MSQATPEQATNLQELFAPELQTPESIFSSQTLNPADRANLITKVYSDFGIFTPETAEQAPELITPKIEQLTSENPDQALEPFVAVNLTQQYGRATLVSAFDQKQAEDDQTWVYDDLWGKCDLANLNRRTIGGEEPKLGDVRAQLLTPPENTHNEPGLQAVGEWAMTLKEQAEFAKGKTLLNVTDYILMQAMRREEGVPLMDLPTFTRFIQMDTKTVDGGSCVGGASVYGSRLFLDRSNGLASDGSGIRLSVGPKEDLNS